VPVERVERKLAAILAADVAGYSRLMGADEEGTLERLKTHRSELIDPKIAEHRGRVVKTTGDGILIEFPSVVESVGCAVEVQQGMADRNADVPEDKRITCRVGINVGDIIIDGDDIRRRRREHRGSLGGDCQTNGLHLSQCLGTRER
jgi:adenylate cyclase